MEPEIPTSTIEQLSQELVNLTRIIKDNEQRAADIKRQIASDWRGGPLRCVGGTVTLVQSGEFLSSNQEMLMQLLSERTFLSSGDAEALINDSRVEKHREAYVVVRLEA